jgi:hypothetical protein
MSENPCLICPCGVTGCATEIDYNDTPYAFKDPITCKELIDNARLYDTDSLWCAHYEVVGPKCCPTVATPVDPCTLCPNGIIVAEDFEPFGDGNTCLDWMIISFFTEYSAESATCTVDSAMALVEFRCCPTVANNPCKICPDGATAGETIVPFVIDLTCTDFIDFAKTVDAESDLCLVNAKQDENVCCPSSTAAFLDYCNICPNGATAGVDFVPWSTGKTCKLLIEQAKIYENGSEGCKFYKGYEMSCCPGASTVVEITPSTTSNPAISPSIGTPETSFAPTPSPTRHDPLYLLEVTATVVGTVAALIGAAFAFAKWKQKVNSAPATSP